MVIHWDAEEVELLCVSFSSSVRLHAVAKHWICVCVCVGVCACVWVSTCTYYSLWQHKMIAYFGNS